MLTFIGTVAILFILASFDVNGKEEDDFWSTRIIGGSLALLGEYPSQISIQTKSRTHICGATLINENHLLTAAHCVTDPKTNVVFSPSVFLLIGNTLSTQQCRTNLGCQMRLTTHVFAHPKYDYKSMDHDIAVIRVSSPFKFTSTFYNLSRIERTPPVNYSCSIAGWGKTTQHDGPHSINLRHVNVTIMDRARCNRSYGGQIRREMICAGTYEGGKDSCQGDSGGAILCGNHVAGVVSFGRVCGDVNYPGVYTNVVYYNDWIDSVLSWTGSNSNIPTPVPNPKKIIPTPATRLPSTSSGMAISIRFVFSNMCHILR
ncbi:hypothetical protein HA402_002654 [Bradysia odoriphaga]|nr:hypothetical protein HA402_002654 [Bradysia odoriphaga]